MGRPSGVPRAALLFTLLLADDVLQLHSAVLPGLLGVSKVSVLAGLGGLSAPWLLRAWEELGRPHWELLGASAVPSPRRCASTSV